MSAQYSSKHGIVSKSQAELYMSFVDLSNFARMIPANEKVSVTADYDSLTATVQGFTIGVKMTGRVPYTLLQMQDNNAPFHFGVSLHFDPADIQGKTDFWIEADADLNLMMKAMLGKKIQEGLDKIVDSLVDISEGRMPADLPKDFNPGDFNV
ncbi:MAG: hypothetical protein MJY53_03210 [Bacteroidales bacterium]|nr:hypothetical protein [Bacteroidales bacterium]